MDQETTNLMALMDQGGWVMWVLLAFSIAALATAIERYFVLRRIDTPLEPFISRLEKTLLVDRSVRDAAEACRATPSAIGRVASTGLRRLGKPAAQLEKSLERRAQIELRRAQRRLKILAVTAATAPLLGFLGTVTGMMESFEVLGRTVFTNPAEVAIGIKEALTTTAAGLVVAVPAQLLYSMLAARVDKIASDVEAVATFLLEAREELATR